MKFTKKKLVVGVIGARGYVGSQLVQVGSSYFSNYELISVIRQDDFKEKLKNCDVIIHSANTGERYFANNNPQNDYEKTVEQSRVFFNTFPQKKWVLISTLSARTQSHHPYGKHRLDVETLFLTESQNLVIRLGPMYGGVKKKGVLYDVLENRPLYVGPNSRYAFTPVESNARQIFELIEHAGLVEIGARQGMAIIDLVEQLKSSSKFMSEEEDTQVPMNPPRGAPDVSEVLQYAHQYLATK